MEKIFKKRPMPKFVMFSKLDKNLLKQMLVKATEISDDQIESLKTKYFNP